MTRVGVVVVGVVMNIVVTVAAFGLCLRAWLVVTL